MTEIPTLANPTYRGETCRGCGKPIVFVLTPKGRREPLERDPQTVDAWLDANPELLRAVLRAVVLDRGQPQSVGLRQAEGLGIELDDAKTLVFVAHFATCPDRDRFRR